MRLEEAGIQRQRPIEFDRRLVEADGGVERKSLCGVGFRQVRFQRQRPRAVAERAVERPAGTAGRDIGVADGHAGIGARIARIDVYRLGIHVAGDAEAALVHASQIEGAAHQVVFVGVGIAGGMPPEGLELTGQQRHLEHLYDAAGDLVLQREDVLDAAIVAIRPPVITGSAVDQLSGNTQAAARLPHAAFEQIADVQLARHLLQMEGPAFESEHGVPGNDGER